MQIYSSTISRIYVRERDDDTIAFTAGTMCIQTNAVPPCGVCVYNPHLSARHIIGWDYRGIITHISYKAGSLI